MSKTVVIHQPDFMPYLGFFHRFLDADLYIVLDHVQFVYGSRAWTHRDKIKTAAGEKWLTVSVNKPPRNTAINKVKLSIETNWQKNNLALLQENYSKAAYYSEIFPEIETLYAKQYDNLSEFNLGSIKMIMSLLDIEIPWVFSSSLEPQGTKNALLVDLLKKVDATHYLSGIGAKDYFDPEPFKEANIHLVWQQFNHPIYPQLHGDFISHLSSLDMLFNCGIKNARKIIRGIQ